MAKAMTTTTVAIALIIALCIAGASIVPHVW